MGENFVLAARHGEILQKISGAAIQIAKKRSSFPKAARWVDQAWPASFTALGETSMLGYGWPLMSSPARVTAMEIVTGPPVRILRS
jgi:hypothetical protein